MRQDECNFDPFANVSSRFGAPMGRMSGPAEIGIEASGEVEEGEDGENECVLPGPIVKIQEAGCYDFDYDEGGAYWGTSSEGWIWAVWDARDPDSTVKYVRATNAVEALVKATDYDLGEPDRAEKEQAEAKTIATLIECQRNGDTECAHGIADEALRDFVESLGHQKVAEAYDEVDKWYS